VQHHPPKSKGSKSLGTWWPAIPVAALWIAAVSGESFWTDEITVAWFVAHDSFGDFWHALASTGSEAQMPLFSIVFWGWARLFGIGELALRCANLPWAILGILAMGRLFSQRRARSLALFLLASPLLCFQMNEARPYIMTFALAAWSLAFLDRATDGELGRGERFGFVAAPVLCCATSMLNIFLLPALVVYGSMKLRTSEAGARRWVRAYRGPLLVLVVGLAVLAAYYAITLRAGHGGQKFPYTWANLGFSLYEWLGFGGLGAPRNVLREIGPSASLPLYGPTLGLGAIAWILVLVTWVRRGSAGIGNVAVGLLAGGGLLVLLAMVAPASLWGRHFIFLAPFALLILGTLLLQPPTRFGRVVLVLLVLTFVLSSLRQRFDADYGKDPYREAIVELRERIEPAFREPIVWVAYPRAVLVYGGTCLPWDGPPASGGAGDPPRIFPGDMRSAEEIERWVAEHPAFILVLHRPDITDPSGAWEALAGLPSTERLWERGNMRIYHVGHR